MSTKIIIGQEYSQPVLYTYVTVLGQVPASCLHSHFRVPYMDRQVVTDGLVSPGLVPYKLFWTVSLENVVLVVVCLCVKTVVSKLV